MSASSPTPSHRAAVKAALLHEKQEQGSMLCAQHALNNLLQGHYFDAPQLAEIATQLDELERENLDMSDADWAQREASGRNADETGEQRERKSALEKSQQKVAVATDTPYRFPFYHPHSTLVPPGFFSVSVLETALGVWGFSLLRWSSAEMSPYHSNPETQLAFILNLANHWFCFRSFGRDGAMWFNLNSFLDEPSWVGAGYLGALLDQSQTEGYSVFVVRPLEESEGAGRSAVLSQFRSTPADQAADGGGGGGGRGAGDLDEDDELQRAIAASMAGVAGGAEASMTTPARSRRKQSRQGSASASAGARGSGSGTHLRAAGGRARARGTQDDAIDIDDGDFDDDASAHASSSRRSPFLNPTVRDQLLQPLDDDDDDELDLNDGGGGTLTGRHAATTSRSDAIEIGSSDHDDDDEIDVAGSASAYRAMHAMRDRDYDDEDAQLQRALAASLAGQDGGDSNGDYDEGGLYGDAEEQARILEQIRNSRAAADTSSSSLRRSRSPTPADVGRIAKMREEAKRKERQERERAERHERGEFTPEPAAPASKRPDGDDDDSSDDDEDDDNVKTASASAAAAEPTAQPAAVTQDEIRRLRLARFGG